MGKEVVIVCPDKHLSGLSASGLGYTDTGNKSVIGGLSREFYQRVYNHYMKEDAWKWQEKEEYGNVGQGTPAIDGENRTIWIFEPHVAAAGISYHVGREANSVYNEKWNGIQVGVLHHGPFSFDNIGMNYDYPEASYERRAEIIKEHENYQKGLLYFYANDLRVPEEIRKEMKLWGLAKDEFKDNDNWPHQLYIREARRMIGEFVMTENEVLGKSEVPESIGMGSYTMDSHNTQRYITPEGYVQNEGDIGVHPEQPYQIALGAILPKKEECKNLLVPVAVSSSHIAFGSIRMEPVFMILGQSAGIVAATAIDKDIGIDDLEYEEIRKRLMENGVILDVKKN